MASCAIRNGVLEIRGSAFGNCLHGLVAELMGHRKMPPPPFLRKVFKQGEESEIRVARYLRSLGAIIAKQQETVILQLDGARITGHIDGAIKARDEESRLRLCAALGIEWDGNWALWEAKSMNGAKYALFIDEGVLAFPRYNWQTSIYSHTGKTGTLPVLMTSELREKLDDGDGGLRDRTLYDDVGELAAHHFMPHKTLDDIQERCNLIRATYERGEIPECDSEYLCDFREAGAVSPPQNNALAALAMRYMDLFQEMQLVEAQLRQEMDKAATRVLLCGNYELKLRKFGKSDKLLITDNGG